MKSATTWKRQAILIQFYTWCAPAEKWGALLVLWGAFDRVESDYVNHLPERKVLQYSQLAVDGLEAV